MWHTLIITMFSHPIATVLLITVSMAKITNKLIIASMTKSELNIWDTSLCPLLVMFLNQYWGLWLPENKLIYIWNGFIVYFKRAISSLPSKCEFFSNFLFRFFKPWSSRPRQSIGKQIFMKSEFLLFWNLNFCFFETSTKIAVSNWRKFEIQETCFTSQLNFEIPLHDNNFVNI